MQSVQSSIFLVARENALKDLEGLAFEFSSIFLFMFPPLRSCLRSTGNSHVTPFCDGVFFWLPIFQWNLSSFLFKGEFPSFWSFFFPYSGHRWQILWYRLNFRRTPFVTKSLFFHLCNKVFYKIFLGFIDHITAIIAIFWDIGMLVNWLIKRIHGKKLSKTFGPSLWSSQCFVFFVIFFIHLIVTIR